MAVQLKSYKLDRYMNRMDSPIAQQGTYTSGVSFEMKNEVQQRFIRASLVNLKNLIQLSSSASGTGTVANADIVYLQTSLTPNVPHQRDINFAIPYVAVYLGTKNISGSQLYPTPATHALGTAWNVFGGFDFQAYTGTNSVWNGYLVNNSGASGTVAFYTQWKWIFYNSGSVT